MNGDAVSLLPEFCTVPNDSRARNFLHERIAQYYQLVKRDEKFIPSKNPDFTGFSCDRKNPLSEGISCPAIISFKSIRLKSDVSTYVG
jgi:hypothetical protein